MRKQCKNCKYLEVEDKLDASTKVISKAYWCKGFRQYVQIPNSGVCAGWEKK